MLEAAFYIAIGYFAAYLIHVGQPKWMRDMWKSLKD